MLDAIKGFESDDMFTAIPKGMIPKEPYTSFVVPDSAVKYKPLKGMRVGIVREFMVKHTKNDVAISDQIDKEIKTVLRDKLGADTCGVSRSDVSGRPDSSQHEVHISGRDGRDPAAHCAGVFLAEDSYRRAGVCGSRLGCPSVDYAVALSLRKAPLSDKINLRRISARLANPRSPLHREPISAASVATRG